LKAWELSFLALILVCKVCRFSFLFQETDPVAKFKEAGEAKENFDLRTIFDNTLVQRKPIDAV
jgi:hypothetical protein